jgi:hypothetical protein
MLEQTVRTTRSAWVETADTGSHETLYSVLFLALQVFAFSCCLFGISLTCSAAIQYLYGPDKDGRYYLGYDDQVHGGISVAGFLVCVIILFSTCRLDVVNVACTAITWRYCWGIFVRWDGY